MENLATIAFIHQSFKRKQTIFKPVTLKSIHQPYYLLSNSCKIVLYPSAIGVDE